MLGRVELAATVGERPLDAGPAGRRAFPQIAYAHHWADRFGRVAQVRSEALAPADTAARWATTRRHIHRQRFGQGDDTGAPAEPETALRVRTRRGAARNLSASSAKAAHRARESAGR